MTPLYPHKGTDQALEVVFSKQLQENVGKCNVFDRKIGMNALLCGNYLEQFSEVSRVGCSDDCLSKCGHLFCTESCKELVTKIRDGNTFLSDDYEDSLAWLNFKVQSRSALMSTDTKNSSIKGKSIQKSECARLENAKYLSDLTMLHLLAEEASLEAEIGFLNVCTEVKSIELDEAVIQGIVENLNVQCDYLKRVCLESIKKLACSDSLETSRLMFECRKAHQMAHLDVRDRQIMEARLNCSKLEIFRDIMALEDSALAELTQCVDKIHTALQRYLDITTEIKTRFKSENELEGKENACATSPDSNAIDSELRAALVSLFGLSAGDLSSSDDELNALLLHHLDKRISALDSKSASSLSAVKEFTRITHEVVDLLSKALHQLECCEEGEKHLSKATVLSSSSVYWNELSPFTGVFPQRLIDRLLQVRKTLDATAVSLQDLEIFYELHSGSL